MTTTEIHTGNLPAVVEATGVERTMMVADDAFKLAQRIANTPFVPDALRGDPHSVFACILAGHEAGISPMQSLQKIHVIKGRPAMSSELMRALVLSAGHQIRIVDTNTTRCVIAGRRYGDDGLGPETVIGYTMDDAKRAGLVAKENWRNHPAAMLMARATSALCRAIFPDVLAGISYTPDEVDGGDDVIEVATDPAATTTAETKPKKKTTRKRAAVRTAKAVDEADAPPPPQRERAPLPGEDADTILEAHVVEDEPPPPPPDEPPADDGPRVSPGAAVHMRFNDLGITERAERLTIVSALIARTIDSANDLTPDEVSQVLEALNETPDAATLRSVVGLDVDTGADAGSTTNDAPDQQHPAPKLTADEYRALCKKHRVKLVDAMRHASEQLGERVVTIDDLVALDDDIDTWLVPWITER